MKAAYFLTHPIQYQSPLIRRLRDGGIDLHVVYASDTTSRPHFEEGFGRRVAWDVPLLDGYPHTVLNTEEPQGSRHAQISHYSRQIGDFLRHDGCDAAWVHGWAHPFTVAAWKVARQAGLPLLLRAETFLGCVRGGKLRRLAHRLVLARKFREVTAFLAVGSLNAELYRRYGVENQRIFSVPYAVDNAFFQARAREASARRSALRDSLGIDSDRPIALFCGKLIDVKDPATLIRAVGRLAAGPARAGEFGSHVSGNPVATPRPILLLAGDGPMRQELETLASQIAPDMVKFLGFRNQTELPALYDLCDVFVLPSRFEPWGLVVNEVMNAGKPVIVSDRVGCGPDLVKPGENGAVFRAGDVDDLCAKLRPWIEDASRRQSGGARSLAIINRWSFEEDLAGMRAALEFVDTTHRAQFAA